MTEEQLYYKDKYLKYKLKYVTLKKQLGGFAGFSRQNKLEGAIADTPSNLLSFGKNLKNAADIEMGNRKRIADEKQRKIDQDKARAGASAANNEKKMEIHDKVKDKIIKEINTQKEELSKFSNNEEGLKQLKNWEDFINSNEDKISNKGDGGKNPFEVISTMLKEDEGFDTSNNQLLTDKIIESLGGDDNILDVDACITKLRLQIKDKSKVIEDDVWTKKYAALGVVVGKSSNGKGMQIAYGPRADVLKNIINEKLGRD